MPGSRLPSRALRWKVVLRRWLAAAQADVLGAAGLIKSLAGQINVVVHALGILLCLPRLLEPGEVIEYVSLGAGNTGRAFDLETNRRIAEFKFIRWQGGPEVIRQNALFKDFYLMAEHAGAKQKYLYVLGTEHPLKFFNSGCSLSSVLSRHVELKSKFLTKFGDQYQTVRDYYVPRKDAVIIQDVSAWLAELVAAGIEPDEPGVEPRAGAVGAVNYKTRRGSARNVRRLGPSYFFPGGY